MISRFSYMKPPEWLVVSTATVRRGSSVNTPTGKNVGRPLRKDPVPCFIFFKGRTYKKDSIAEACRVADKRIHGKMYQEFRLRGWHKFIDGSVLYIQESSLPKDTLDKILNSGDSDDLCFRE